MNKYKKICVDIDGTLCSKTKGNYENAEPYKEAINKINRLYNEGHYIILFTSRYMSQVSVDKEIVYTIGYKFTFNQLKSWGVKFHELKMGKPEYDLIIDDKSYNYNSAWVNKL